MGFPPPRKTQAFWEIVNSSRAPEDAELADALDALGFPGAVTLGPSRRPGRRRLWRLAPRRRFESSGYVAVRNDNAKDGLWKVGGATKLAR
jgi:hypothetical protein